MLVAYKQPGLSYSGTAAQMQQESEEQAYSVGEYSIHYEASPN